MNTKGGKPHNCIAGLKSQILQDDSHFLCFHKLAKGTLSDIVL